MARKTLFVYNRSMPELPEVETVVRDLRPHLVSRKIVSVRAGRRRLRQPWVRRWQALVCNRVILDVRRRGKWIVAELAGGYFLIVHLGMTGQLVLKATEEPIADHTHLIFTLDRGLQQLRFRDIRRFGSATVVAGGEKLEQFFEDRQLGPEPFRVDRQYWTGQLNRTHRCLKATLLDQRVIAGVGNIYADESLFEAKLPPTRLGKDTAPAEADRLRRAVEKVLRRAIEQRGSSIRNYVGGSGLKGGYQEEFRVYGRAGQPCRRCRAPIVCIRLAGRATHFCPQCQKSDASAKRR
jgi:formamidopyrimidine-DNA glycosylase